MLLNSGVFRNIAPQAYAETAPQLTEAFFAPRTGISLRHRVATYGLMYRKQPHLFSAIDKVANLVAKLSVGVYDTSPDSGDKLDRTGPYAKLMRDPFWDMPTYTGYHWLSTTYEIYGEAYLVKMRTTGFGVGNGKIIGLVPMHPSMTYVRRDQNGHLIYGFTGAPDMWHDESQVIPFRRYNPDNRMRGLSRMEPLRDTLMNEDSLRRAQQSTADKMFRPSYILTTPKTLGTAGFDRLEAAVQSASGADGVGGVMVLEDDVTAVRMQLDAEEMQYIQSRTLNRTECFEVYDVNPAVMQINDNTTATSWPAMTKDVYKQSIDHRLRDFESTFNHYVGTEYNGPKDFRFEVNNSLRADIELLAPAVVQLIQSLALKPSEARQWLGLPDAGKDADQLFGNQAIQALSTILEPPEPKQLGAGSTLALPSGNPSNNANPNPLGDLPKKVPALTDKGKQYRNQIFSGLGRGKDWDEVALKLMDRNPDDRQDIAIACLHILTEGKFL